MATAAALAALLPVENVEGAELDSDEEALGEARPPPPPFACRAVAGEASEARGTTIVHGSWVEGEVGTCSLFVAS